MYWLIIFLLAIIVLLLAIIFGYKKDIKYISKQIKDSEGEYCNIRITTLNKDIEQLALCINYLYEKNQKINAKIKHSEEELRRSIANLSHDLRTPLTSIIGYMQLIKSENLTTEEREKYIDIIQKRASNLQDLITSFYELSRIESSEYKFDLKAISLSKLLSEAIAIFYDDFINKNIEPNIQIQEGIPNIIGDEKAVLRIFSNLIANMIKHGEGGVSINLKSEEGFIITEFSNSAPNLKEENINHIFDRFFTANLSRSEKNTGLGLSIVKALVEKLGHRIMAELHNETLDIKIIWKI
ncbi:HAMP domain-containing histidine kinase [Clostridium sp. 19966]|uniref:sensor histidine kinase n=1 Tax=Clostridium sp. 19966 TaxID=2768166 RepID=UPI0028E004CC|nr:HAMP domain-containing sensor histidine kinase [Clostridium sp. 19966]MDT8716912.1 HAMP domain-containing histidine kinase [Clostridium sp. 19966]